MKHKVVGFFLVTMGLCLILCSGLLVCYNLLDSKRAEESVVQSMTELQEILPDTVVPAECFTSTQIVLNDQIDPVVDVPYYVINPQIEMLEHEIDGIPYIGILEVPCLELELPIISRWSNANARKAPCRYKGSVYSNDIIICAHNYKSHFGKLSTLSIGDTVSFTDIEGNQFHYQVVEFEVMDGTAIEQMESGNWHLTLFTCTAGGKSPIAVRTERISEQ